MTTTEKVPTTRKTTPGPVTTKPAAKQAAKPATVAKTRTPTTATATATVAKPTPGTTSKSKKPKMVRDSFTIPKSEYDVLDVLKLRAAKLGTPAKKTELIRAGIKLLASLPDVDYQQALAAVPTLKTGRPAKAKKA